MVVFNLALIKKGLKRDCFSTGVNMGAVFNLALIKKGLKRFRVLTDMTDNGGF